MTVEVVGWEQLAHAMGDVPKACEDAAADAARDAAASLAATTRASVPKRSGRLASSILPSPVPDGVAVMFGAGVPYAGWIEYGGTHGRPYVAQGRYLGAGTDAATGVYVKRAQTNTDANLRRLAWP